MDILSTSHNSLQRLYLIHSYQQCHMHYNLSVCICIMFPDSIIHAVVHLTTIPHCCNFKFEINTFNIASFPSSNVLTVLGPAHELANFELSY